jgi:hypothetical protein
MSGLSNGAVTNSSKTVVGFDTSGNAYFSGHITTTSGSVGGWKINSDSILSDSYVSNGSFVSGKSITGMMQDLKDAEVNVNGSTTMIRYKRQSLVDSKRYSNIRFVAGCTPTYYSNPTDSDPYVDLTNAPFMVLADGSLYASAVNITGTIHATNGKIGAWNLNAKELVNYSGTKDADGYYPNSFCMQTAGDGALNALAIGKANENTWSQAAFRVTVDGSIYASNIIASGGRIGGFELDNGTLTWNDNKNDSADGLKFTHTSSDMALTGININGERILMQTLGRTYTEVRPGRINFD